MSGVPAQPPISPARRRVDDILDRGVRARLVVVQAPPGFGKTTVVTAWLRRRATPVAWLSGRTVGPAWWPDVAESLRALGAAGEPAAAALLRAVDGAPGSLPERMLTGALELIGPDVVLLVDDADRMSRPATEELSRLVGVAPPALQIVVVSRTGIPLPVARRRAQGSLIEIGPADLLFVEDDIEQFANDVAGRRLDRAAVARLHVETAGWPLAVAIWSGPHREPGVDSSAERDRDEQFLSAVLDGNAGKALLLATAAVDHLTGPLCDALGGAGSAGLLDDLVDAGLVVDSPGPSGGAPDVQLRWFERRPPLTAVLRRSAARANGAETATHRAVARWLRDAAYPVAAVRHHVLAEGLDAAAAEVVTTVLTHDARTDEIGPLAEAVSSGGHEVGPRPAARLAIAAVEWASGRAGAAGAGVAAARAGLQRTVGVGSDQLVPAADCLAALAMLARGDPAGALPLARAAAAGAAGSSLELVSGVIRAVAAWWQGETDEAVEATEPAMSSRRATDFRVRVALAVRCLLAVTDEDLLGAHRIERLLARSGPGDAALAPGWRSLTALVPLASAATRCATRDLVGAGAALDLVIESGAPLPVGHAFLLKAWILQARGSEREAHEAVASALRIGALDVPASRRLHEHVVTVLAADAGSSIDAPSLTPSEVAVLHLFPEALTYAEMATRLFLSVNTVKTHARRVRRKLGAGSRSVALARARSIGLLATEPEHPIAEEDDT